MFGVVSLPLCTGCDWQGRLRYFGGTCLTLSCISPFHSVAEMYTWNPDCNSFPRFLCWRLRQINGRINETGQCETWIPFNYRKKDINGCIRSFFTTVLRACAMSMSTQHIRFRHLSSSLALRVLDEDEDPPFCSFHAGGQRPCSQHAETSTITDVEAAINTPRCNKVDTLEITNSMPW